MKRLDRDENGATIVIFALSITVFVMMCSLVLDFGVVYYNESKLQNALDASVLAAGQLLPVSEGNVSRQDEIESVISQYLNKNGLHDLTSLNIEFKNLKGNNYMSVEATLTKGAQLNFAKIIGVDFISVTKNAQVSIIPCIKLSDVLPLSVKKTELDNCIANGNITDITLKFGGGGGTEGDFGAIDLDGLNGGGSSDYERWLTFGYTSELSIGEDLYPIEPGNMAGATSNAFNARYFSCTHFPSDGGCNNSHFDITCKRVIKIPVVTYVDSKHVNIVAFAGFVLNEQAKSTDTISGSFINMVATEGVPAETQEQISTADYGVYSLRLSK